MNRIVMIVLVWVGVVFAAPQNLPLPEMVVSKCTTPPKIDGRIEPGEWDRAAACSGFVRAFEGDLAKIQTIARVTYDDQWIYVAFTNHRGAAVTLLDKHGRKPDDEGIVFDPSNEVWLTPPVTPATTYQSLFNSYPAVLDVKMIPSVGYTAKSWKAGWEIAATESNDEWTVEARAPIKSFGVDRIADGAVWRGLFTADVFKDGNAFRAWAPGGAFADIPRHGTLRFKEQSAVFQLLDVESIFTGKVKFPMAISGRVGPKGDAKYTVTVRFGAGVAPAAEDVVVSKSLVLDNTVRSEFAITADLTEAKLPTRKVINEKTKEARECKHGICEITAKCGEEMLYHQVFPFDINGFVRTPPKEIVGNPYKAPFGLEAFYAPLSKKLLVKIDRYYLAQRAAAVGGRVRLSDAAGKTVAERAVGTFRNDYSEFPIDLASLAAPVETEEDWKAKQASPMNEENRKIGEENKKRKARGEAEFPLKDLPGVKAAEYKLDVALTDAGGKEVASTSIPVQLMGYQFEWLGNTVGISDKVIPPWTPIKVDGATVAMWNKAYQMNALGVAEKITNGGAAQLSGAMKMIAVVDGKEVEIKAGAPNVKKVTEANLDLTGEAKSDAIELSTNTRVEFDGFVLNEMTIAPTKAKIERLSLVVTMPEAEAPCFVTTAGGWSAYHGWTPDKWDSRETAIGSMIGNFVPYVFLTDSERGFCWFADNDKGWILDPAEPTLQLERKNGVVTFRCNFITKAGAIEKATTVRYGWMVTPQKPQPKHWRGYHISQEAYYPQTTLFFWNDADWAVLWPYYSSPFPRDYEKSKKALAGSTERGVIGCPGSIAHAIARYADYKWRWFNPLGADWGSTPGDLSNGNVARSRGPNDFQVWHDDRWVKSSGLRGLYFDETYLSEDWNYLTGGAHLLANERVQPGYSYLGLREYYKRLRYMFHENGVPQPNLWLHTTSGHPVYAWMPDLAMEGENVEPANMDNDYIEALPAGRLRSIDMGRNLGAAPTVMCQSDRHWNEAVSPFMVHQFVGWVLAHDVLPEGVPFWMVLASELELWREDVTFVPYWKKTPDPFSVSAHVRPGNAVLWIVNTAREDRKAAVRVDLKGLGLEPERKTVVYDAETGERYAMENGQLSLEIPKRMWRCVRLMQPAMLKGRETFVAHFESEVAADEAFGARYPRGKTIIASVPGGVTGNCAPLDQALQLATRHHVSQKAGRISFKFRLTDEKANCNSFLTIGDVRLSLGKGRQDWTIAARRDRKSGPGIELGKGEIKLGGDWHAVEVSWKDNELRIAWDGAEVITAKLESPIIAPMGRGLEIRDYHRHTEPLTITFGAIKGGRIDDLTMEGM